MAEVHATTVATTEAHHEVSPYTPASPEFWVWAALTFFILAAIFVAKAPKRITDILDARIAETRRTLDEAKALRAEAEALLADARAKAAASAGDADSIVRHAEAEAKHLVEDARAKAADLTQRRQKMAEDKIAAAERAAVGEVRARAANVAASVAAEVIRQSHDAKADAGLVDAAIDDMQQA